MIFHWFPFFVEYIDTIWLITFMVSAYPDSFMTYIAPGFSVYVTTTSMVSPSSNTIASLYDLIGYEAFGFATDAGDLNLATSRKTKASRTEAGLSSSCVGSSAGLLKSTYSFPPHLLITLMRRALSRVKLPNALMDCVGHVPFCIGGTISIKEQFVASSGISVNSGRIFLSRFSGTSSVFP